MSGLSDELMSLWRLARRWLYLTFRRGHVRRQVARRKGECGRHGCCHLSALARFRRCYDPDDPIICLKHDDKPFACRMYPFDEKDKHPATIDYCNFYWDDEDGDDNPSEGAEQP